MDDLDVSRLSEVWFQLPPSTTREILELAWPDLPAKTQKAILEIIDGK